MKPVKKAVFPVAGFGTRFLPATKSVPKELLPVVDRPLIQYAVDEALAAGIEQMIFVTGRSKHAIEDYFDRAFEVEEDLHGKAKYDLLEALSGTRLKPGQAAFVRQQEMAGLGHAVWCARHLVGDEPFAVLLPDELLWNPGSPCLSQMCATYARHGGNVIAVEEVPEAHTHRYGIVDPGSTDGAVMAILSAGERGAGGEIQLTDALAKLIGHQPFHAQLFAGARHDCGDKVGFIQANIALALEREELAGPIRAFLAGL